MLLVPGRFGKNYLVGIETDVSSFSSVMKYILNSVDHKEIALTMTMTVTVTVTVTI